MKAHRHHSPRTAIILILISVLSFAFVACDASEKCLDSKDMEACVKGCNDKNSRFRWGACERVCDFGFSHNLSESYILSACSESCKLSSYRESSNCRYPCEHGDTAACEKYEKYEKYSEARSAEYQKEKAEREKEACHVTTWQLIGDVPNQSISNFSWGSAPISIPEDAAIECATTTGSIERFQTAVELGERPNPASLNRFSKELLKCGKAIGSNELVERAKKCNGKWY